MNLIDTHAHIYLNEFDEDRVDALDRAVKGGVGRIFMPNIDSSTLSAMLNVESQYPEICKSMIGLHPCSVKENFQSELQIVENELRSGRYIAIGEIGTDLYWDDSFWEQQVEAFMTQLELAKKYDLPVAIHCRETLDKTIEMVERSGHRSGVFHCFTGTAEQAQRITTLGYHLGIGGVSTFKNGGVKEILPQLDLDKIVLETDSPYLAPIPNRGKRNEPGYLVNIALVLAAATDRTIDEIAEITTRNALALFPRA